LLFVLVVLVSIACPCVAVSDLVKPTDPDAALVLSNIAGYALLLCGIVGTYLAAAMVVNTTFGKKVLPNPGPILK
jgi:succinate-acetate transporter protein